MKRKKANQKRLTYRQLVRLAKSSPPPQSWYEETNSTIELMPVPALADIDEQHRKLEST